MKIIRHYILKCKSLIDGTFKKESPALQAPHLYELDHACAFTSVEPKTFARAKKISGQPSNTLPLVSVVTVCKNADDFLRRAIASVKAQDYPNIEYIIQDKLSTDKTREIVTEENLLKGFVSEADKATLDGLLKAAARCKGEYIAVCWADDELLPHAVSWGVSVLQETGADVVYGDQIVDNALRGDAIVLRGPKWDGKRFFLNDFYPPFSSSFYRRDILLKLAEHLKVFDHDEYEFWVLLDLLGKIHYEPGIVSRFHVYQDMRWTAKYTEEICKGKKRAINDMCRSHNCLEKYSTTQKDAYTSVELWAAMHLTANADSSAIPAICDHMRAAWENYNGDYRFVAVWKYLRAITAANNYINPTREKKKLAG